MNQNQNYYNQNTSLNYNNNNVNYQNTCNTFNNIRPNNNFTPPSNMSNFNNYSEPMQQNRNGLNPATNIQTNINNNFIQQKNIPSAKSENLEFSEFDDGSNKIVSLLLKLE